jgi:hypothetical protein
MERMITVEDEETRAKRAAANIRSVASYGS